MKKNTIEDLRTNSVCVVRASKFCADIEEVEVKLYQDIKNKELWTGDSWFGSVQTVAHLVKNDKHFIMIVKTAHSRSPKQFLDNEMKHMPGRCWIDKGKEGRI